MKKFIITFIFLLLASNLYAQEKMEDVVYLKNGSIIRGTIVEQIFNVSIRIKTKDGSVYVYKADEVEKVTKELLVPVKPQVSKEKETSYIENPYNILFGIGLSIPNSPDNFSDYWKSGINALFSYEQKISETIILNGSFSYHKFGLDEDELVEYAENEAGMKFPGLSIIGGNYSSFIGSSNIKFLVPSAGSNAEPFFLVGIGYANFSIDDVQIKYLGQEVVDFDDDSEGALCLNFGGGISFPVNIRNSIFIECKVIIAFTEDDNTIFVPLTIGWKFR